MPPTAGRRRALPQSRCRAHVRDNPHHTDSLQCRADGNRSTRTAQSEGGQISARRADRNLMSGQHPATPIAGHHLPRYGLREFAQQAGLNELRPWRIGFPSFVFVVVVVVVEHRGIWARKTGCRPTIPEIRSLGLRSRQGAERTRSPRSGSVAGFLSFDSTEHRRRKRPRARSCRERLLSKIPKPSSLRLRVSARGLAFT